MRRTGHRNPSSSLLLWLKQGLEVRHSDKFAWVAVLGGYAGTPAEEMESLEPAEPKPAPSTIVINSPIDNVTKYHGKKGEKSYTIYTTHIGENKITTFDKTMATTAKEFKEKNLPAQIEYKQTEKGLNLVSINPVVEEG